MVDLLDINSSQWDTYLESLEPSLRDIYFTRKYYKMYQDNGDGSSRCFVYKEGDKLALYPFMLNKIKGYNLDKDYFDIETAYGYGGPIASSDDKAFLECFENCFLEYCISSNIVAEFIRFHPLIKNNDIFSTNINVLHNRSTVYLDLKKGIEEIWNKDIKSKDRNMIRKAVNNGLKVERCTDYEAFKEIYSTTMDKVNADDYYYFKDSYYQAMKADNNYILLTVLKENIIIASAIFMKSGKYFHYHLAGSLKEYLRFAPNNLLLWEAIKIACEEGTEVFHFGGGLTDSTEDSLFKFKSSFSKTYSDFYIGKRVHNKKIYDYIIKEWENKNEKQANMLLQYKY